MGLIVPDEIKKINVSAEAEQTIKEIADMKGISVGEAIERVIENQAHRELRMLKDVQTTIKNIKNKES